MANILTEGEQRDATRIAARRAREADRVQRFLHDPYNRQVGQDYQGLREQIAEKEERDAFLKNQEEEEIEQQRRLADRMQTIELQREDDERRRKEQVVMANKALARTSRPSGSARLSRTRRRRSGPKCPG